MSLFGGRRHQACAVVAYARCIPRRRRPLTSAMAKDGVSKAWVEAFETLTSLMSWVANSPASARDIPAVSACLCRACSPRAADVDLALEYSFVQTPSRWPLGSGGNSVQVAQTSTVGMSLRPQKSIKQAASLPLVACARPCGGNTKVL